MHEQDQHLQPHIVALLALHFLKTLQLVLQ